MTKGRKKALDTIRGDTKQAFAKLWDYENELRRYNPTSKFCLKTISRDDGVYVFQRFYIGFSALKEGWKLGCRLVIGLDGCFLKWITKGELLSAIGRDANNQLYPIAWAVVEVENTDSWMWFLQHLRDNLGLGNGSGFALITDLQKGLDNAINTLLPNVEHRMCARHIYSNSRKKHKEDALKILFWDAVRRYTKPEFLETIEVIKKFKEVAYRDLMNRNPSNWARAFFSSTSTCEDVSNNMSESFNGVIRFARTKLIVELLEDLRRTTMQRMAKRAYKISKWSARLTPRAQALLENSRQESGECSIWSSSRGLYEVNQDGIGYTVNLVKKTCACREWDVIGIPCAHAVASIMDAKEDIESYVSLYYTTEYWTKAYSFHIEPVNGEKLWEKTSKVPILPPIDRVRRGRPSKRKRTKGPSESPKKTRKVSKKGRVMTCSHCWQVGHNRSGCTRKDHPPAPNSNVSVPKPRGRPRKPQVMESIAISPSQQSIAPSTQISQPAPKGRRGRSRKNSIMNKGGSSNAQEISCG